MASKRGPALIAAMLGLMLCELSFAAPSASHLLFEDGFETGLLKLNQWKSTGTHAPEIESTNVRAGKFALKSRLEYQPGGKVERTEVRALVAYPAWFEDTWYGFSVYLEPPYASDSVEDILAQWQGSKDWAEGEREQGGPALSVRVKNGKWTVVRQWDEGRITTKDTRKSVSYDLGSYAVGQWTDWVVRVHWDYRASGAGLLQVWMNGKQVVNASGQVGYNDANTPYFKMGVYKSQWKFGPSLVSQRTVYHDAFRMAGGPGASYDDVAPSLAAEAKPLPPATVSIQ